MKKRELIKLLKSYMREEGELDPTIIFALKLRADKKNQIRDGFVLLNRIDVANNLLFVDNGDGNFVSLQIRNIDYLAPAAPAMILSKCRKLEDKMQRLEEKIIREADYHAGSLKRIFQSEK